MKRLMFIMALIMTCCSCDDQLVEAEYRDVSQKGWAIDDVATFDIQAPDTTQAYNLYINLRNTHEYAYNNLWMISQMKFPEGKIVTDTLEYEMANAQGAFLGTGSGDVYENKLWWKEGVRFRESGTYQLTLRHAMRKNGAVEGDTNLKGILEVGYSIEKQGQDGNN